MSVGEAIQSEKLIGKHTVYTDPDRKPRVLQLAPAGVPDAITAEPRWVLWRLVLDDGKWTKRPVRTSGRAASSTNPKTWTTFALAVAAYQRGGFDGIGFVLGDGWAGIDLDDVRNSSTGKIVAPWAADLIERAGTHADVSPSGTGVKLFGRGAWAGDWHKKPHPSGVGEIEVYDSGRFFCVTGTPLGENPVGDIQPTLDGLAPLFGPALASAPAGDATPPAVVGVSTTDDEIIERAHRAKNGDKFARLWDGDTTDYGGDDSRADLALCSLLAFWCGPDADRIDRLFRRSGLMRAKWDTKRKGSTYGAGTVAKAIASTTEFYSWDDSPVATIGSPPRPASPAWPAALAPEAFHGLAGRFVRALEPATEADTAALLVQLLVGVGNAVGRTAYAEVDGSRHYTNEFAVLVGKSAKGRKGTSLGRVTAALTGADPAWATDRIQSGLSTGEGLIHAVRDPIQKQEYVRERGQAPTYESVTVDEGVADKRLLVTEPEFAGVLKQTERHGNTLSPVIRQAWDSGSLRTLTKNSPAKATGAHVSIIGHITSDELKRCLTATETANGFANRFLWVCVKRSKFLPEGGEPDHAALAAVDRELSGVLSFARTAGELKRDDDARELWCAVYETLSGDRHGLAGSLLGRAEAHVLRLSLLYAVMDKSPVVTADHLHAALAVWDYCEASVLHLFGSSTGNPTADEILNLLRGSPKGLSRTTIRESVGKHVPAERIEHGLAVLHEMGLARHQRRDTAGRPSEVWTACQNGGPHRG